MREKNTIAKIFQKTARKYPEKTALIFQGTGESWTFHQLDEYSNQVANFFYGQGFRSGDVVALFMESRNQYVGLWLGLAKIGVETALVNSHLRLEALLHCITISSSKAVVFGVEMMEGEGLADVLGSALDWREMCLVSGFSLPFLPTTDVDGREWIVESSRN